METFLQLLADKKIDVGPLITHRFPVERAQHAYDLITGRAQEPFLGVLIQYPENSDTSQTLSVRSTSAVDGSPSASASKIAVGLLGAGGFATSTLIPAMVASRATSLVTVCAATGSRAQNAAKKFAFRLSTTNELAVIENSAVNTVVIATRNHLHAKQVMAALEARKHVFCEKPLCLTIEELEAITRTYTGIEVSSRPAITVGFNRRFAPMIVRMKSFLNAISDPLALNYRINAGYLPPDHWMNDPEQGGGRILGEVCHFIDLLMFLASSPIVEVAASSIGSSSRYSGDNVLISLRLANGSRGTISYLANGDRSFSKERLEAFGGGSTAVLEDFRRLDLVRDGRKQTMRSRLRQDKGHVAEWAAFVVSVQNGGPPPIAFNEIVCSSLATICVQRSIATGAAVAVDTSCLNAQPNSTLSLTHSR